ncbi:BET1-like protein isoform X3 [Choloepus didactylus]|uniref:BET1-like protein isoform X3 n=1 Tax=Choloepus didactylus TaxID=27675 RepID=UPI0018A11054|nr:BET1-like protein isoform X3 [Choloepus didactylus]
MADWARAQSPGAVEEILDRENKRMADSLASKVTRLKSVVFVLAGPGGERVPLHAWPGLILPSLCPDQLALDIDRDAEDQNRYLDGMAPWMPLLVSQCPCVMGLWLLLTPQETCPLPPGPQALLTACPSPAPPLPHPRLFWAVWW